MSDEETEYEICWWCNGVGLFINNAGEPDECYKCKGDTVLPKEENTYE